LKTESVICVTSHQNKQPQFIGTAIKPEQPDTQRGSTMIRKMIPVFTAAAISMSISFIIPVGITAVSSFTFVSEAQAYSLGSIKKWARKYKVRIPTIKKKNQAPTVAREKKMDSTAAMTKEAGDLGDNTSEEKKMDSTAAMTKGAGDLGGNTSEDGSGEVLIVPYTAEANKKRVIRDWNVNQSAYAPDGLGDYGTDAVYKLTSPR